MRYPIFDRAGKLVYWLREEESRSLLSSNKAEPKNKHGAIRALKLKVSRQEAMGHLRGPRKITSDASKLVRIELVGDDRARLYQHDHDRCDGFGDTLQDRLVVKDEVEEEFSVCLQGA